VVIQHAVWLCLRFTLSYRDVEDLLAQRGLDISYETIRRWVLKFGRIYAGNLRRRRPRPSEQWHLDEMVVMIGGRRLYLWRAVDDEGEVLDILVQSRRNKAAAVKLLRKLMKKLGFAPRLLVTDKLPYIVRSMMGFGGNACKPVRSHGAAANSGSSSTGSGVGYLNVHRHRGCTQCPRRPFSVHHARHLPPAANCDVAARGINPSRHLRCEIRGLGAGVAGRPRLL